MRRRGLSRVRVIVGDDELVTLSCVTRVERERATGPCVCRRDWERHAWVWQYGEPREVFRWQRLRAPITHPN